MVVHSAEYLNDFVNSFHALPILRPGDKVAILSPSFAAPAVWPHVHELGCQRLREVFGLEPIEFPTTRKLGAPVEDKMRDLIQAFEDPSIKAVISTLGGDEQVTWVKKLPREPFMNNPKPFFGYSDNGQFMDFLWKCRIPSFYG
ncbi:MAG: LD-carboxypeptidase, partial [Bdellovibrionales bacterium]|nr:LD-carboxypeptidase [Bdellovibrionales bacterium]